MDDIAHARRYRYRSAWVIVLVTLPAFFILDSFDWNLFRAVAAETTGMARVAAIAALRYAPQIAAVLAIGALLFGGRAAPAALGLDRSPLRGLAIGLCITVLMPLSFLASGGPVASGTLDERLLLEALMPGIGEEILYRGFLFGFLFRFARWGFLPAALLVAAIFGAAHLYQSADPSSAAAIFAITALGSIWFAWLYAEWDFDIWVPASVHVLLNGWWELFAISDTALGPMGANLTRLGVIGVSAVLTLAHARRRGGRVVRGPAWYWGGP